MDDTALVLAATSGDRDALAAIYDRYGDRLYDYCWSILRDRDEAADAFHDAFCAAAQRLHQLRDPAKLRPWLYAIARHEALRRSAARRRQQPTEELDDVTSDEAGPEESAGRDEAVQLVWAAAAGLNDRDRALLDLNLRQGLEGQELADAVGVSASHGYVLLSRLRDQVERSLGALLVARHGRLDCPELARLLESWDGRFSPLIRKRVARHVDDCETCAARRRSLASPLALLSATPLLPAPARLRERVLRDAQLVAHSGTGGPGADGGDGFPPSAYPSRRGRVAATVAAAALVLGALALVTLKPPSDDGEVPVAAVAPTAALTAASTTSAAAPAKPGVTTTTTDASLASTIPGSAAAPTTAPIGAIPPPGAPVIGPRLRLASTELDFGTAARERVLDLANDGDVALTWTASTSSALFSLAPASGSLAAGARAGVAVRLDRAGAPEGPLAAALRVTSEGAGGTGRVDLAAVVVHAPVVQTTIDNPRLERSPCSTGPTAASIQATVTDESAITGVVLRWEDPSGRAGSRDMVAGSGGVYSARLGPFTVTGTTTWWVEATDALGAPGRSSDRTTPVGPC